MPVVKNEGSAARDFCMLERNILSHFKLALLLLLLSASILLHARLPTPQGEPSTPTPPSKAGLPIAILQMLAALAAILAGTWEYLIGNRDLRQMKAFLAYTKFVSSRQEFSLYRAQLILINYQPSHCCAHRRCGSCVYHLCCSISRR